MNDEYTHSTQSPLEGPKYITMNGEYTHSPQSPLEGPKYIKKNMYKIKTKKRQNILLTNTINETKR